MVEFGEVDPKNIKRGFWLVELSDHTQMVVAIDRSKWSTAVRNEEQVSEAHEFDSRVMKLVRYMGDYVRPLGTFIDHRPEGAR